MRQINRRVTIQLESHHGPLFRNDSRNSNKVVASSSSSSSSSSLSFVSVENQRSSPEFRVDGNVEGPRQRFVLFCLFLFVFVSDGQTLR